MAYTKPQDALERVRQEFGLQSKTNSNNSTKKNQTTSANKKNKSAQGTSGKKEKSGANYSSAPTPAQTKLETVRQQFGLSDNKTNNSNKSIYLPKSTSSYGMTQAEYDMRRSSNPSMPAYGSYEYYKSREESLRPIMEEISNDFDRRNPTYKAWVENYNAGRMPNDVNDYTKEKVISLSKKFKYQDSIISEYKDINEQLQKFDKQGIHYKDNGEIDTKSGAEEAKYAKERYRNILSADALTTLEMAQGFAGQLPEDKQKGYYQREDMANKGLIEARKEDAYNYYEKNKDNVYEDTKLDRFLGNYKVGRIGIKSNQAGATSFNATSDDIEASEVYQALGERIQQRNIATFKNNGATDEVIAIIGQYAPQGVDQAIVGTVGRVVGGLVGNQRTGRAIATASYMYEQTAGATYVRLLQESDLSVEDAKKLAANEALSSSAVEFGLDFALGSLWSKTGSTDVAKNTVSQIGGKLFKAFRSIGISEKGANTILKVAENAGKLMLHSMGEGAEEWWQEGISITADRYAAEGETASPFKLLLQSLYLPQYSKDDFNRMGQSFLGGMIVGIGQGGIDAISSYGINKIMSNNTPEQVVGDVVAEKTRKKGEKDTTQVASDVTVSNTTQGGQRTTAPATIEQASRDVVSGRNNQSGTPLSQRLEALSRNNEQIAVEDVKKATGFGEEGSKLVTELANRDGVTFSQAESQVKTAYLAGMSNADGKKVNFVSDEQINAFTAGKKDRAMQDLAAKEKSKNATVYKGAFHENEYTKNYTDAEKTMITTFAKTLRMDVDTVDKIIASVVNGREYEANAEHQDGRLRISNNRDASAVVYKMVMHESGHRMRQLAPTEFGALMDALYERAEKLGRRTKMGVSQGLLFDKVKAQHDNAGIAMNTSGYMEEIAVRELETLFNSPEEFNAWYSEISTNQQAKTGLQKFMNFISELIEDIKRAITELVMPNKANAIKELERIKELYANALKAAEKAASERAKAQAKQSAEAKAETKNKAVQGKSLETTKTKATDGMRKVLGDGSKSVGIADGQAYVTNGSSINPSPENRSVFLPVTSVEMAKAEFGATKSDKTSANISKILAPDSFVPVRENFVDGTLENVGEVRIFTDQKGREIALEKNVAEYFEGYNL